MALQCLRGCFASLPILGIVQLANANKGNTLLAVVTALCGLITIIVGIFITHYLNHVSKENKSFVTYKECDAKHKISMNKIQSKYDLLNQKIDMLLSRRSVDTQMGVQGLEDGD